jgi:hypothetical protein
MRIVSSAVKDWYTTNYFFYHGHAMASLTGEELHPAPTFMKNTKVRSFSALLGVVLKCIMCNHLID